MGVQPNYNIPSEILVTATRNNEVLTPKSVSSGGFGWDKILDAAIGLGSAWAAVELDARRIDAAYNQAGAPAGYYRTSNGSLAPIPVDAQGRPLPGYTSAGMLGGGINSNMLTLGVLAVAGFLLLKRA